MPRIIFKCPYIKPGTKKASVHLNNYVRYVATRDGVEKLSPDKAALPATKKQRAMVERLLRDFPMCRGMFEYEDYQSSPTRAAASEFITRAIEDNYDQIAKRENYVSCIAQRPRAERLGAHGLFNGTSDTLVLSKIAEEVANHPGNVWLPIISLRREDAARLGYDNARQWQALLSTYAPQIADAMKIPWEQFRWYASYHDEGTHPHVHMVCYSADGRSGFLDQDGIAKIKSGLAKNIFRQELIEVYRQQTQRRDELVRESGEVMRELIQQMHSGTLENPRIVQVLMDSLPDTHKARWFAGAALNSAEQAMASVMSTVLSRLNAFLDSELEQVLCFDSAIDAEAFASQKSAIFLVLPEEDPSKNFMAGLMIQTLSRELFSVADENGGKLPNRVVLFCDELGTMPAFDILPLFSAGRSRKLTLVPIIQSLAQLEKNYGKEGAEIIVDNVQDTIFGGFAPNSQTAEVLSKALGSRTVMSGSVSKGGGKDSASRSLQMMERPLMTPDELKSIPKGQFVVMKTGTHPMQTRLRLFLEWGISFGDPYLLPERAARKVAYASKQELEQAIFRCHHAQQIESDTPPAPPVPPKTATVRGGASYAQARRTRREPPPPVVVRTDGGRSNGIL